MEFKPIKLELRDDLGNDLLFDNGISDLMKNITNDLINGINQKREKIIRERLKEITGIEIDVEEESKRRFKRLAIEYNGNKETIYFNDGSKYGRRIVTFVKTDKPLTFDSDIAKMSVEYSYY